MNHLKEHQNHIDLGQPQSITQDRFDLVIIGSGAGGGVAAEILSQSGLRVAIVEEGPLKTQQDFKLNEASAYPDLYQEAASRKTIDKSIAILQGRSVGGSTTVNWTSSFRTPPQVLDHWQSEFGIQELSPQELEPWFKRMEQRLSIQPWVVPPNANNQTLFDGAQALGWHAAAIPRNVRGCANLGYCGLGCPLNAKQSMLVTTIPQALQQGARLYSNAYCETVKHQGDKVSSVILRGVNRQGKPTDTQLELHCDTVILSAGAMGSPAILMRSKLPDPENLIGKRTFLHPVAASIARMKHVVDPYYGAPQSIYSDEFLWRDGLSGKMGYKLEVPPIHPVLGSTLIPMHGKLHSEFLQQLPYLHASLALLRDGFHQASQGGTVLLDGSGRPLLDYPLNDYLWEGVKHAMQNMVELQFAAGAERVYPIHMDARWQLTYKQAHDLIDELTMRAVRAPLFSAHVMGGAAMGDDAKKSVVNSRGRLHQMQNLYVLDASIFPTSLGVNPQLTIYALSAKLASQLAESLQ